MKATTIVRLRSRKNKKIFLDNLEHTRLCAKDAGEMREPCKEENIGNRHKIFALEKKNDDIR